MSTTNDRAKFEAWWERQDLDGSASPKFYASIGWEAALRPAQAVNAEPVARFKAICEELDRMIGKLASPERPGEFTSEELAWAEQALRRINARKLMLPPGATAKERFRVSDDGLGIWDEDFTFDANLKISGDFATEDDKRAYARELVALLNTTPAPAVAPAAQSAETAWANLPAALKAHPGIKALYRAALASQKGA